MNRFIMVLALLALTPAFGADEVRVLKGKPRFSGLSSTGMGGSIERAFVDIDLRVQNLSFSKRVGVRWTRDAWKTWQDAPASYVRGFEDGSEHWSVTIDLGTVGKYVMLGMSRGSMGPSFVQFAAYAEMQGRSFWDNGSGRDHAAPVLAPWATALPEARSAPQTAISNGALYLVGGQESQSYRFTVPNVLVLEPGTRTWRKVADLPPIPSSSGGPTSPSILVGYSVVATGNALHVLGGTNIKVGGYPRENLRLDLGTLAWKTCAELPGPLVQRAAVATADEIHVVPTTKSRPQGDSEDVYVYDVKKDKWQKHPVKGLDFLVNLPRTCVAGESLYFFSGTDAFVYTTKTRTVSRVASPPAAIDAGARVAALDDSRIAVANVAADLSRGTASVLVLDVLAGAWTKLDGRPLLPFDATLARVPAELVSESGGGPVRTVTPLLVFTGLSRVDVFEPIANLLARGESRTVLRVHADVGVGHSVFVRGSAAPLSWSQGTACQWTAGNDWVFSTTEILDESFRWKPLKDDQEWRTGSDVTVRPGETITVEGLFH